MPKTLRVGIFVVATLAIFAFGIFWIGNREFRFVSTFRLNAEFQNVAGLDAGAAVRVGGIHEGSVRRIVLPSKPDQKVRVEMDIKDSTRNVLKKDSVASIRTEGLVGDQYIEITFGSPNAPAVKNGDTVGSEPPLEISDMIKKTNAILDSAQTAMKNVDQTAGNLQEATSKLNNGKGTVGALFNDRGVYQHINEAAQNLQDDTEALKHNFLLRGFFKKRGYEDQAELKQHAIAEIPQEAPARQFEYAGNKLFGKPDEAKIRNSKMLDEAGHFLEAAEHGPVVIAASAGGKGDSDRERAVTEARAAVVREYLVQHFHIDDKQVRTIGLGKSQDSPDGGEIAILTYPAGTTFPRK